MFFLKLPTKKFHLTTSLNRAIWLKFKKFLRPNVTRIGFFFISSKTIAPMKKMIKSKHNHNEICYKKVYRNFSLNATVWPQLQKVTLDLTFVFSFYDFSGELLPQFKKCLEAKLLPMKLSTKKFLLIVLLSRTIWLQFQKIVV